MREGESEESKEKEKKGGDAAEENQDSRLREDHTNIRG